MKQDQTFVIRQETPADYRAVEHLTREAFWNQNVPGCDEHYYLHCLRRHKDYLPALSFVLETESGIVASVHSSRAWLRAADGTEKEIATFGPFSVLPAFQRRGFGGALLKHLLAAAEAAGTEALVIFGNPDNYVSRGFVSCAKYGISMEGGFLPAAMLVKELAAGALAGKQWVFREHDAGACLENEAAMQAFDTEFPPKQKAWQPSQEEFFIHSHSLISLQ